MPSEPAPAAPFCTSTLASSRAHRRHTAHYSAAVHDRLMCCYNHTFHPSPIHAAHTHTTGATDSAPTHTTGWRVVVRPTRSPRPNALAVRTESVLVGIVCAPTNTVAANGANTAAAQTEAPRPRGAIGPNLAAVRLPSHHRLSERPATARPSHGVGAHTLHWPCVRNHRGHPGWPPNGGGRCIGKPT